MKIITEGELRTVIDIFSDRPFSTYDVANVFQDMFLHTWKNVLSEYGKGGHGAGTHFSAYSLLGHSLDKLVREGYLDKLNYRPAPKGWGSPVIRYWRISRASLDLPYFPDEIEDSVACIYEGAKKSVKVNVYERDPKARAICIKHWGIKCYICSFDFENIYGIQGAGFIHVHHIKPLHEIGKSYKIDPIKDLRPVCPNCHAMLHHSKETLTIEKLKKIVSTNKPRPT